MLPPLVRDLRFLPRRDMNVANMKAIVNDGRENGFILSSLILRIVQDVVEACSMSCAASMGGGRGAGSGEDS